MRRDTSVIGTVVDLWGDPWNVRERRPTKHGFDIMLGWPSALPQRRGGPSVIVTVDLLRLLERHRRELGGLALPIGATSIKRLRRLLGHHRQIDAAEWWAIRAHDLTDLTIEAFAARHGKSLGAIVNARHALYGTKLRPAGWWRAPDVAEVLLSASPTAEIADRLGIAASSVRRLRAALMGITNEPSPP